MWPTIRTVGSQETKRWGRIWATRLPRDQSLCMLSPSSQAPDQPLLQETQGTVLASTAQKA